MEGGFYILTIKQVDTKHDWTEYKRSNGFSDTSYVRYCVSSVQKGFNLLKDKRPSLYTEVKRIYTMDELLKGINIITKNKNVKTTVYFSHHRVDDVKGFYVKE